MATRDDRSGSGGARRALDDLLGSIGLATPDGGGAVVIEGSKPDDVSPHLVGTGSAVALAANAVATAAWWRLRSGRHQAVREDVARAVQALHVHAHTRQHGRRV